MSYRIIFALVILVGMTACSEAPDHSQSSPKVSPNETTDDKAPKAATDSSDQYPLDVCVVSGEKLGSMGPPVEVKVEGQTVKLCCAACKPQLLAEPAKYLAKLNAPDAQSGTSESNHGGQEHDGHNH